MTCFYGNDCCLLAVEFCWAKIALEQLANHIWSFENTALLLAVCFVTHPDAVNKFKMAGHRISDPLTKSGKCVPGVIVKKKLKFIAALERFLA